ncbi:FAD-dependent oxidoreductase [Alloalcanivorax marinus]|uniref:FAD-dependent oxidoreductase n=1 Tax=Alloalcanivorax marinus TaxID=1177169 RepID=UPI001931B888|nr:NAD(P)/FAD-dependent oxidoreductase [Alloalcanivorax marinus]MBL7251094.1 FAD-dependent monooxygenase [Alloalcanivorax marinus]
MQKKTVEIIGAGLSGLVAANRFAQLGWKVRIHERNKDLRMFGAGIWIWESGLKTLETVGAYDQAVANARVIREWQIRDPKDRVLMSRRATPDDRLMLPPRADLYQALIDRAMARKVEIITSSEAVDVSGDGTTVFADGSSRKADLVIVANGAHSRLREQILGTKWIDYGSEIGIRMLIDERPEDNKDTLIEYWNGNWRLLYNPCTDGRNYIFLSAPVNDARARRIPIDSDLWVEKFPGVRNLISRFQVDGRWDRLVNVKCRKWTEGKVAIVGDAAHAMPPNLGQAANTAFINVMALAEIMSKPEAMQDVAATLIKWESQQRSITDHVQWWSYLYGYVLGRCPPMLTGLRSGVLRAVSRTGWFDRNLNKGARYVPDGYVATDARNS